MKVLVLGSGPAGLVATHAAVRLGFEVGIISLGRRSPLHGAQYLHAPIPGLSDIPSTIVTTHFEGSVEGYKRKVYGDRWRGTVSPEQFSGVAQAWDIRHAYDELWNLYSGLITPFPLDADLLQLALNDQSYDAVFSTIPANKICKNTAHDFKVQEIWAAGDAPEWKIICPVRVSPGTVQLDGTRDRGWYRCSNIFSHCTVEWPWNNGKKPPVEGISTVRKPLATNCNCWPEITRLGRYGKWSKGELVHRVYSEVQSALKAKV